jgi:pyruvate/2-oxoglutarate dehydrogenase complex dihydrolipoamide acyltransferase (E2) component
MSRFPTTTALLMVAESVTFLVKVKQAIEDPRRLLLGL